MREADDNPRIRRGAHLLRHVASNPQERERLDQMMESGAMDPSKSVSAGDSGTDDATITVLFFKTVFGKEGELSEVLKKRFLPAGKAARQFLALGATDICVIAQGGFPRQLLIEAGTIPDILNCVEYSGDLVEFDGVETFFQSHVRYPIVVVSFVRMSSPMRVGFGSPHRVEREFVDEWAKKMPDRDRAHTALIECYGGPTFLVLRGFDNLDEVPEWSHRLETISNDVADTYSIVLVTDTADDATDDDEPKTEKVRIALPKGSEIEVRASWRPGAKRDLSMAMTALGEALQFESNVRIHCGCEGISARFRPSERDADFLAALHGIRRKRQEISSTASLTATRILYSSETISKEDDADRGRSQPDEDCAVPAFDVRPWQASQILRLGDLGRMILRFLYHLSDVLDDPANRDEVVDLFAFAGQLSSDAINVARSTEQRNGVVDRESTRRLASLLQHGRLAIHQRLHGMTSAYAAGTPRALLPSAGLSRILQAITAVPMSILAQWDRSTSDGRAARIGWPGIVRIGERFRTELLRVIVVSEMHALDPAAWVAVIHETGHIIGAGLRDEISPILEKCVNEVEWRFQTEVVADIVSLNFSPVATLRGIKEWLRAFWYFHRDEDNSVLAFAFHRTIVAFAIWRMGFHAKDSTARRPKYWRHYLSELLAIYEGYGERDRRDFQKAFAARHEICPNIDWIERSIAIADRVRRKLPFRHREIAQRTKTCTGAICRLGAGNFDLSSIPPELATWVGWIGVRRIKATPSQIRRHIVEALQHTYRARLFSCLIEGDKAGEKAAEVQGRESQATV